LDKMIKTLIGIKSGMTHAYDETGKWLTVTRLALGPCTVLQSRNIEKDGYRAVQLSFGTKRNITKPMAGHLKKSGTDRMPLFISEVITDEETLNAGSKITASDVFFTGDVVNVAGITRGRGFTGVVKRWGFHGGPKTHGQSDRHRAPGSIGQGTTPGRVYKGKKMAGRSGTAKQTIRNLRVVKILPDEIWVTGAVPGARGGYIEATVIKPMPRDKQEEAKQ